MEQFSVDEGLYGYLRDHADEHLNLGNIDENDQEQCKYNYVPVGISLRGKIEPICRTVAEKYFLRPGDITSAGNLIVSRL